MSLPDHYATLGVHPSAEEEVITAAYRSLAKKYHPDAMNAAASSKRFVEVQEAYGILRDPLLRKSFDEQRASEVHARAAQPGHSTSKQSNRESRRQDRPKADAVPTAKHTSILHIMLLGVMILTSTLLAVEITRMFHTTPSGIQSSQSAPQDESGNAGLSDGTETGLPEAPADPTSNDSQPPARTKQIYDRLAGEQEIRDEGQTNAADQPKPPALSIEFKSDPQYPAVQQSGKGSLISPALESGNLPDVRPPPPLPIPGSDQQG